MRPVRALGSSLILVLGGYLVLVFVLGPLLRRAPEGPHEPDQEILRDFRQSLSRDAILPVYDPAFVAAAQADLRPDELVMGVQIEGEARAYPVGFLRFREMVNDRIGPIPFLVTWCPICHTGIVYDRRVDGREMVFGNQGALYKNAMTFWDHETESVWSQVTGEVLFGPLEGTKLEAIPAAVESWAAWRETYPGTLVLVTPGGFDPEPTNPDFVIGVAIGDDAVGFRFPEAAERGITNDEVGGTPLTVFARSDHLIRVWSREVAGRVIEPVLREGLLEDRATGSAWDPATGMGVLGPLREHDLGPIPWATSFDWAWLDFHPNARIID